MTDAFAPVPFSTAETQPAPGSFPEPWAELAYFTPQRSTLSTQNSPGKVLIPASIEESHLEALASRFGVQLWPDSTFSFDQSAPLLTANRGGIDCYPFKPAQPVEAIRQLLGVESIWQEGFKGKGIAVAVVDQGINGSVYPVIGGHATPGGLAPSQGDLTRHGSMCAAAVLLAAPDAQLYDYPLWPKASSGKAIAMFEAMLTQGKADGTLHIISNSYGLTCMPPQASNPSHESHDINHPLYRKIREVIASGGIVFFWPETSANNIQILNVIHLALVRAGLSTGPQQPTDGYHNSRRQCGPGTIRLPGLFHREKLDLAAYTHCFGHFGSGRPGGLFRPYDDGTSAATPLAAGVATLQLSANPTLSPAQMKQILLAGAASAATSSWKLDVGFGIIHAVTSWNAMRYL